MGQGRYGQELGPCGSAPGGPLLCPGARRGHDWTDRFGWIVEAASKLRADSFVIDGEGVILRPDGVSDFDRLHSRGHDGEVQLLGFDLLELDGTELRREPLDCRKATLASLLRRSRDGIQYVEHIEATDGATVFEHACKLGLEGIRVQAPRHALQARPQPRVAEDQESGEPSGVASLGGSALSCR